MAKDIRILIVEDHQLLAEGLTLALDRQEGMTVVGTASSVAEGLRLAIEHQPDVALVDFHLPDGTGAELTTSFHEKGLVTAVVILTGDTGETALLDAVGAGATGFLLKSDALANVITAVRRAAEGEILLPAAVLARLVGRQRHRYEQDAQRQRLLDALTAREPQVLELMAQGLDTRAIADQLVVSYATVRGYIQNILNKLGAHSKLEAVARAGELGLLHR
jgi:DNA-binding NarL/FixJ family response regulator